MYIGCYVQAFVGLMKFRRLVGENPRKRELENPGSSDVDLQTFDGRRYMGV